MIWEAKKCELLEARQDLLEARHDYISKRVAWLPIILNEAQVWNDEAEAISLLSSRSDANSAYYSQRQNLWDTLTGDP